MNGSSMKHRIFFALALVALGAGALGVDSLLASEEAPAVESDQTTASKDDVQASTPAEEMGTRVRSIRRNEYFYQSYGRKDLFAALVTGDFEPQQGGEIVDVNVATLVGVIWGAADRFALVEDGSGNGYILRVGDRVANGRVTAIQKDSLVAAISLYGITSRVVLQLENREGDQ